MPYGAGIDFHTQFFTHDGLHTHAAEQLQHGGDVVQVRQVAYFHRVGGQQGRRHDRQCRVLRTRDADFAFQRNTAVYL